jgi:hypothetical protein
MRAPYRYGHQVGANSFRSSYFSSVITILFPVFASYKALRSSDPSQLAPWLMYWVVLSGILLVESWTIFILGWYERHIPTKPHGSKADLL